MFLLIDNYDSFTYNLAQAFQTLGKEPIVIKNDDPALLKIAKDPELEMVCISPGPGHPASAGLCNRFLELVDPQIPILGICLGHQLLGAFAGAEIAVAPVIMHGKQSAITHDGKGMFTNLPSPLNVGRYHSLVVKDTPQTEKNFTVTARGPEGEVMGLKYVDRPWVGAQFHPESVLTPDGMRFLANFPEKVVPPTYEFNQILDQLAKGSDLDPSMATQAFEALMDGELSPSQSAAFLMGLKLKGEKPEEIAQAIKIVLKKAVQVPTPEYDCIDIVGTGGDGKHTFNCSTAAALTLAGMGYKVLKHGNRAVSSTCGAADALDGLGIGYDSEPGSVEKYLNERNFAFMFAPYFHPGFKNVGPIRKELGIPTLFNILGPMINPARPSHLCMGVARAELIPLVSQTLSRIPIKRAAVLSGAGGYDELTTMGPNPVAIIDKGEISELIIEPKDYGMDACNPEDIVCHTREEAIETLRKAISGRASKAVMDMVSLNAGLAIYLLEPETGLKEAIQKAARAVHAGKGAEVLHA